MSKLRTLEEELRSDPQLKLEDIKALREWANTQPHLPNIDNISDVYLSLFLKRRYYDLERAKQTLDNYLTFRTNVPDMSTNRTMKAQEVKDFLDTTCLYAFDQTDSDGYVVMFCFLHESDPSKYDLETSFKTGHAILDSWYLENGGVPGQTVIYDQQNMSLRHLTRISLSSMKNVSYFNKDCSPVSMKKIILINANPFIQKILAFFKPVLKGDVFRRMHIFTPSQMDDLYKMIPRESLPNEYGGSAGSLEELQKKTRELLRRNEAILEKGDRLKVDESKRPGKKKSLLSFKKMDLD